MSEHPRVTVHRLARQRTERQSFINAYANEFYTALVAAGGSTARMTDAHYAMVESARDVADISATKIARTIAHLTSAP